MNREVRFWLVAVIVVIAGVGIWLLVKPRPHGTVGHVEAWLRGECPEVHILNERVPLEKGFGTEERILGQTAVEYRIVSCGGLGGSITFVRFPSTQAREQAIAHDPILSRHSLFCVKGSEMLVNGALLLFPWVR